MLILQEGQAVVKTGTFLYDGQITCDVVIVRGPICYGSGDYEDPPEFVRDHEQETFYIHYWFFLAESEHITHSIVLVKLYG